MCRSIRKISRSVFVALFIALLSFLGQAACQVQTGFHQPEPTPTFASEAKFEVHIPQKAIFKNYVVVSVEALPGTHCELTYIPPSGDIHQMESTANTEGLCEWRWKVEESEGKGDGRLIFTIDGKSETHFFEILSSF